MNDLVFLGLRDAGAEPGGQKNSHGFSDESGAGIKLENAAPFRGRISGLFQQFTLGGMDLLFARVDATGG